MTPTPSTLHQAVLVRLLLALAPALEKERLGQIFCAPIDVELDRHNIVQPDVVVVLKENRIVTPSRIKGVPNHVIEILSPSTCEYDRGDKRALYERVGVSEYWLVDPDEHELTPLVLVDGRYQKRTLQRVVPLSYAPNVTIDFDDVW